MITSARKNGLKFPAPAHRYHLPPGGRTRQALAGAKKAIGEAEPEQALRCLAGLKIPALETEVDLLSGRLAEYRRSRRLGVQAPEEESREFSRLSRDIRDLVGTLENELATATEQYRIIRDYLKKRYANRLGQKLARRQPVNLRRAPSTEGTSAERAATFITCSGDAAGATLAQNFEEARGRLLLIGTPGAGKTTLMLQLALELLDTEPDALPVLLNLATWTRDYVSLEAWLMQILPAELGVSERLAAGIVQQNHLLLLLDGFDEVQESDRASCLDAIGRYGEDGARRYVLSSRKEEYAQVSRDAPVESEIEVQPLTVEQLETELQRLHGDPERPERGAQLLGQAIRNNELLRGVVRTPFYFNTLQILFAGGKTWSDLQLSADTPGELQRQIVERFAAYELEGARGQYAPERSERWLAFLASRMAERNMVVFELRDLQYDWWGKWSRGELVAGGLVLGLVAGLALGLIAGLGLGLVEESMVAGLIFGPFIGLVAGLVTGLRKQIPQIYIIEKEIWSGKFFVQALKNNRRSILLRGLSGGLFAGLFGALFMRLEGGLFTWLFTGLALGLAGGLASGIYKVWKSNTGIIQITSPYHHFNASMKAFHFPILQHRLLCYQLRQKGLLPPNLVAFLNGMSQRHILEFDGDPATGQGGGTWRFRHRILQEYFAGRWVEE